MWYVNVISHWFLPRQLQTSLWLKLKFLLSLMFWKGSYHQCSLDQESQPLTTFIMQFGRFKYLRALYFISSIFEYYSHQMMKVFTGLSKFHCMVNDIIITTMLQIMSPTSTNFYSIVQTKIYPSTLKSANSFRPKSLLLAFNYHHIDTKLSSQSLR